MSQLNYADVENCLKYYSMLIISLKAYTIVCTSCGRKKAGTTIDRVEKKWNRRNVYSRNGGKYYATSR